METIIDIRVGTLKDSFLARKTIDLPFMPNIDAEIEDGVWARDTTKKIEKIILNINDPFIHLSLYQDIVGDIEQSKKIYALHGWTILNA